MSSGLFNNWIKSWLRTTYPYTLRCCTLPDTNNVRLYYLNSLLHAFADYYTNCAPNVNNAIDKAMSFESSMPYLTGNP